MSMNTIFVPLCVGSLVTVTVSGCFFFQDEDCFGPDYCDGDKVWTFDGPEEWSSGCVENIEEDCSETGRVCQEYDDGYGQEAGCFYPDIQCEAGTQALCDGVYVYRCDSYFRAAFERESCAETGRVCREYTDTTGETAGCFFEGISCKVDGGEAVAEQVCDDDIAYVCDTHAAMAFKTTRLPRGRQNLRGGRELGSRVHHPVYRRRGRRTQVQRNGKHDHSLRGRCLDSGKSLRAKQHLYGA